MSSVVLEARGASNIAADPKSKNLRVADWLFRSNYASVLWLVVRVWLGYQWLNAGYQKVWGSEKMVFWYGGGAGVYGFAKSGVTANATPMGAVGFGWWAGFLHNFVMPNASCACQGHLPWRDGGRPRPHPRPVRRSRGAWGSGTELHLT